MAFGAVSVPTQWSSVECVWASLASSPSQACQSCFLCPCEVWSCGSGVDPRAWWEMLQANVTPFIIYCVSNVCLLADSVEEERVIPLYTFVIPLPLWGMPQLMKASLLSTFLISVLLTSPVSWSACPRRIVLHSSFAWVKIFPLALFLPLHTLKSHLCCSIGSQRLYPQPLTPPFLCWW